MEKLEQISLRLDIGEVKDKIQGGDWGQVQTLLEVAKPLISAKAVYKVCYIEQKLDDTVIIDGIRLRSRILRRNLEKVGRVNPTRRGGIHWSETYGVSVHDSQKVSLRYLFPYRSDIS